MSTLKDRKHSALELILSAVKNETEGTFLRGNILAALGLWGGRVGERHKLACRLAGCQRRPTKSAPVVLEEYDTVQSAIEASISVLNEEILHLESSIKDDATKLCGAPGGKARDTFDCHLREYMDAFLASLDSPYF